jgi:crotonobetainyl-CoA:carnitine CoA-transferase CaiB-like acyl-CoA transferase
MMGPLDGVRVLDLTRLLPGAYATLLLADLGADVVKVEDPRGGDGMRSLPTSRHGPPYFALLNRNKRSVTLDLRSPDAPAVLDALCRHADVSVDSFRPSTARRLGVDAATLRSRHPHLVCASISGFGQSGPYVERAAHDINYQALAGLLFARGSSGPRRADQDPLGAGAAQVAPEMPGPLVGDIGAATRTALGILAALLQRVRTGVGSIVDVSIHEAAMAWTMFPSTDELANACYNIYETADGQWLALGALEPKFWIGFCERIGRPDLAPLQHAQGDERARVLQDVRAVMRGRTRDEWLARFAGADVCLSTIHTLDEAAADPHVVDRGLVSRVEGAVHVKAANVQVRSAPALGADTDDLLESAGIDAAERARLRAAGVI